MFQHTHECTPTNWILVFREEKEEEGKKPKSKWRTKSKMRRIKLRENNKLVVLRNMNGEIRSEQ